jgi:hypothetical protein
MMPFEYFLEKEEVKKCSPDMELARSLIKDMQDRISKSLMLNINTFPKFVFENIYDGLRDFCDALLAAAGFKSYSHQASIAYLSKENFNIAIIEELDQLRYKRNGSKYYGRVILTEDALQIRDFYSKIKGKINKVMQNKRLK